MQVGYVGGEGHHLFDKYTVNLIDPATGKRPLSQFSSFGLKANDGNNNFNALQVSLQRRFVSGFLFQTNYMWSHAIADASLGSGQPAFPFRTWPAAPATAAAPASMSATTSSSTAVYELPFGHGKKYLERRDGFAGARRLGTLRPGAGAHRPAGEHHHDPQGLGSARRQHVQPASRLRCRPVHLRRRSDHQQLVQPRCVFATRRRAPGATLAATSPTGPALSRSTRRWRNGSASPSATRSICAPPRSTCSTIRSSRIRPAISPNPASVRSPTF